MKKSKNHGVGHVISVSSSLHRQFVTSQIARSPVSLVYPVHTRGAALGYVLTGAYLKYLSLPGLGGVGSGIGRLFALLKLPSSYSSYLPRVLICGGGKHLYYMFETFIMNMEVLKPFECPRQGQFVDALKETIVILSNDPAYTIDHARSAYDVRRRGSPPGVLAYDLIRFSIKRSRKRTTNFGIYELELPLVALPPYAASNVELVWKAFDGFDIVVLSDESPGQLLRMISEVRSVVQRNTPLQLGQMPDKAPLLIVAAETGNVERLRNIGDALAAYEHSSGSFWKKTYFPSPYASYSLKHRQAYSDVIVDILDDAKEQAMGMLFPLSFAELPQERESVRLHVCLRNDAGTTAELVAALAGLRPVRLTNEQIDTSIVPCTSFSRYVQQGPKHFAYTGFASLTHLNADANSGDVPAVLRLFASLDKQQVERQTRSAKRLLQAVKSRLAMDCPYTNGSESAKACDGVDVHCPEMPNCPVAVFSRHLRTNCTPGEETTQPNADLFMMSKGSDTDTLDNIVHSLSEGRKGKLKSSTLAETFAKFTLCSAGAEHFASLAVALNALQLRRLKVPENDKARRKGGALNCLRLLVSAIKARRLRRFKAIRRMLTEHEITVLNCSYMREFDCYEDSMTLATLYGSAETYRKTRHRQNAERMPDLRTFKGILIRPTPEGFSDWWKYANQLRDFLSDVEPVAEAEPDTGFQLYPDESRAREHGVIILIRSDLYTRKADTFGENLDRCFCSWKSEDKKTDLPHYDCPFNKELQALFESGVLVKKTLSYPKP